jgi:hypothetical protein
MTGFGIRRAHQANAAAAPSRGLITAVQMSRVPRPQGCKNKPLTAVERVFVEMTIQARNVSRNLTGTGKVPWW